MYFSDQTETNLEEKVGIVHIIVSCVCHCKTQWFYLRCKIFRFSFTVQEKEAAANRNRELCILIYQIDAKALG